jgi:hypothetical protein
MEQRVGMYADLLALILTCLFEHSHGCVGDTVLAHSVGLDVLRHNSPHLSDDLQSHHGVIDLDAGADGAMRDELAFGVKGRSHCSVGNLETNISHIGDDTWLDEEVDSSGGVDGSLVNNEDLDQEVAI